MTATLQPTKRAPFLVFTFQAPVFPTPESIAWTFANLGHLMQFAVLSSPTYGRPAGEDFPDDPEMVAGFPKYSYEDTGGIYRILRFSYNSPFVVEILCVVPTVTTSVGGIVFAFNRIRRDLASTSKVVARDRYKTAAITLLYDHLAASRYEIQADPEAIRTIIDGAAEVLMKLDSVEVKE